MNKDDLEKVARVIEKSIVPRIARFHAPSAERSRALAKASEDRYSYATMLARLVLEEDEREAAGFVRALLERGAPAHALYLDLLAPAARVLGELWSEDEADIMRVALGSARLQVAMRALSSEFMRGGAAERNEYTILLATTPGEAHVFGIEMTADFFRRDGWRVELAVDLSAKELVLARSDCRASVVGMSLGAADNFASLRATIRALKASVPADTLPVLVGGAAFALEPELALRSGADALAPDAASAVTIAAELCGRYIMKDRETVDNEGTVL